MILGIHHIAISTPDIDRLSAFYRDVMGFEVHFQGGWPQGTTEADDIVGMKNSSARMAFVRAPDFYLELFEYSSPPPRQGDANRPACDHGYTHFCIAVRDIDYEYERLKATGMPFHCPPANKPGKPHRATYGRDPDGNIIELIEILAQPHPFGTVNASRQAEIAGA